MAKLRFGPYSVETSNTDKEFFPKSGITKGDVIDYYQRIADPMMRHLRGRPLSMQRFPDGITGKSFFQKEISDYFPDWIDRVKVSKEEGSNTQVVCNNAATLVYLANQACLTPHVWLSPADSLDNPDRLVFDLDPSTDDFSPVRKAARLTIDVLKDLGLPVYVQTTGSRGLHIVVPIDGSEGFDPVREFAGNIADVMVHDHPELLTTEQHKNKRGDRVYIDIGRNAYGQTMVSPYAIRPLENAPIATPLELDELDDSSLNARKYNLKNIFRRMSRRKDPWFGIGRTARSLSDARRRLARITHSE